MAAILSLCMVRRQGNLLCLMILVLCASCEKTEKVEDFPRHKSLIVANCFFMPDSPFVFDLSKSLSPLDNAPFAVMKNPSAFIRVYEDQTLFDSIRVSNGRFIGTKLARPGHAYRFECQYPGYGVIRGSDRLADTLAISSMSGSNHIVYAKKANDSMTSYRMNSQLDIEWKQPVKAGNYLLIQAFAIYIVSDPFTGMTQEYKYVLPDFNVEDASFNSEWISGRIFLPDNGNPFPKLTLNWTAYSFTAGKPSNQYRIVVQSCSKNTYDYIKRSMLQVQNQNDPFAQPAPVPNNIENGFGIFSGLSTQYINITF